MSKSDDAWDAVADVQSAEAAALRALFGTAAFRILSNAGVTEQSARDREVAEAIIVHVADAYLYALKALSTSPADS